jgi:hypothetical protein
LADVSMSKVASGVNMCACLKHRIPNEPQQGPQLECIVHVFWIRRCLCLKPSGIDHVFGLPAFKTIPNIQCETSG